MRGLGQASRFFTSIIVIILQKGALLRKSDADIQNIKTSFRFPSLAPFMVLAEEHGFKKQLGPILLF